MTDLVGQQLGNYRLICLLGSGSFANVYLAEHLFLSGRQVAIKVLHSSIDQQGEREKFLKEAQVLAKLEHPHILPIFDTGIHNSFPYLVTQYAPNGSLRQLYPHHTIVPLDKVITYVTQVASALQYAHTLGVIHRDIKPENMLLNRKNEVLLGDFGIATISQGSRQEIQDIAGTAAYIAPEQLQGRPDRASDQYALGVVAYEWLCGMRPFQGSFAEIATQHLSVPPVALREKMPTISREIEQVIMQVLLKEPKQRFSSIAEFATALEKAAQLLSPTIGEADESNLPTLTKATLNQVQQQQPTLTKATLNQVQQQQRYSKEQTFHTQALPPADEQTFHTQAFPPVHDHLDQISESKLEHTANAPLDTKRTVARGNKISQHTQEVYAVTWSPDGKYITSSGADKMILRWEVSTARKLAPYRINGKVYALACSPDRRYIASAGEDKKIQVWDIATTREHFSYTVPGEVYTIAWSPNGKYIASAGADRILHVQDVSRRDETCAFSGHTDWIRAVIWSPDGTQIASASNDQVVHVWDFTSHAPMPVVTYENHTDWVRALTWSPEGTNIASAGNDETVHIWNAKTGETKVSYTGHATKWTGGVLAVAWSPDGKCIASAGEDQTVQLWNPTDGKHILTYKGHTAPVDALAWSPDGQRIASGSYDRTVRIWQVIEIIGQKTVLDNMQAAKTI